MYAAAWLRMLHAEACSLQELTLLLSCLQEIDDDAKLRPFFDKRLSQEVEGEALGEVREQA